MIFSKSFGYALRSVLYIALVCDENPRVQIEEVAIALHIPWHFLGKVMKQLAKEGIIDLVKGPFGGFSVNIKINATPLIKIISLTDSTVQFNECILRLKKCNAAKPCPLHNQMGKNRKELTDIFKETTLGDLMKKTEKNLIGLFTLP